MKKAIQKADILLEALPYIKKFQHKVMVIKCGGRQLMNKHIIDNILQDIVFMNCVGLNPVLIHGGGPSINQTLQDLGKKIEFHQGFRVTDKHTLTVVVKELNKLNQLMVKKIRQLGAKAEGLSGQKGKAIKAKKLHFDKNIGFVGEVAAINTQGIKNLLKRGVVPVLTPLGIGRDNQIYNINADMAAAEIAAQLGAWKLVLLTDVQGIMYSQRDKNSLISTLKIAEIKALIKKGIIHGGMLPKVASCVKALKNGVKKTHIIDGGTPRSLLLEIFTNEGIGTQIVS
ncbi:MAG: acetylglutamate kinase [Candidatus Omnitrophota bacterium]|nr:MAG: acetylglutamate kinase [Candidatus Omnitrophota bacterium]